MSIDARFRDSLNFRDLGGLKTNDGRRVKSGYFYRGAGLDFYNEVELDYFRQLGIKTIMDIRSTYEREKYPDPYIENAKHIGHSGLESNIDWSPQGMSQVGGKGIEQVERILQHYKNMVTGNEAYKIMMKEIFDDQLPIYFHCAVGKDRTGVAAIIILLALNVKEEEIKKDYLLSNVYRKEILDKKLDEIKDKIIEHPELQLLTVMLYGVYEEIFNNVIASIQEKYASYDEYIMQEYDISKEKLMEFRDKYLENSPE